MANEHTTLKFEGLIYSTTATNHLIREIVDLRSCKWTKVRADTRTTTDLAIS